MSSDDHKVVEVLTRIEQKIDSEIASSIAKIEAKVNSDIIMSLSKIETKIEGLNDTISKVVYGLLAIVAATVGVEFLPNSPIDWYGATLFAQRFFSIASMVFLVLMLSQNTLKKGNENKKWLAIGLISLATILSVGTIDNSLLTRGLWFYLGSALRITYTVCFTRYAWGLNQENLVDC